jgi:hypothetical protein
MTYKQLKELPEDIQGMFEVKIQPRVMLLKPGARIPNGEGDYITSFGTWERMFMNYELSTTEKLITLPSGDIMDILDNLIDLYINCIYQTEDNYPTEGPTSDPHPIWRGFIIAALGAALEGANYHEELNKLNSKLKDYTDWICFSSHWTDLLMAAACYHRGGRYWDWESDLAPHSPRRLDMLLKFARECNYVKIPYMNYEFRELVNKKCKK